MTYTRSLFFIAVRVCLFGLLCLTAVSPVSAEDGEYLLSERTHEALNEIHALLEENRYDQALTRLQTLRDRVQSNRYETAVVDQTMGYAFNGQGQYDRAAEKFIAAAESNALPRDVTHRLRYNIVQLLAQTGEFSRAVTYLERWFAEETDPSLEAHKLAAGIYHQVNNNAKVIEHARIVIARAERPDESVYQLLLASYFEEKQYSEAARLLQRMLVLFPDKNEYWRQLAGTYQLMNQDKKALAVNELAYNKGLLNEEEKLQLARLYLHLQAPYRAARLLEREFENNGINRTARNLELLADSYYMARETEAAARALGEAAELAGRGELYYRHGQLLVHLEKWPEAVASLKRAVEDNELQYPGEAHLLLGIAAHRLDDTEVAMDAFRKARDHSRTQEQAERWLEQIRRQIEEST
jgi:tetratricopeptide (TPR) repeat protein